MLEIKKLNPNAVIPKRANPTDAGLDLTASQRVNKILDGGFIEYKTGIAVSIPEGYVGLLFPRSSVSKKDVILANSVGVIDPDYKGEISFRFKWAGGQNVYNVGDRVGQLLVIKNEILDVVEVEKFTNNNDRGGGFGSTGI